MSVQLGNLLRRVGRAVDNVGLSMQGPLGYFERLVPKTTAIPFKDSAPATAAAGFVAPNSSVVGNVTIAESASVWYGATVRGDGASGPTVLGAGSSIGDRSSVVGASIGAGVTVGPNAQVAAGAKIGDGVVIGANARVAAGAVVGARAVIAPGSVVAAGAVVQTGQVVAGNPAVVVRAATDAEVDATKQLATDVVELARAHAFETNKDYAQLQADQDEKDWQRNLDSDHWSDINHKRVQDRQGIVYNRRPLDA
jgi:carbonic anhydrase/acetyltransferase-like protein (isoleucine patch superfamily)